MKPVLFWPTNQLSEEVRKSVQRINQRLDSLQFSLPMFFSGVSSGSNGFEAAGCTYEEAER